MLFIELMLEVVKRKKVVRGGKIVKKKVTDKKGYKVKDGREVKMSAQERLHRKKGARVAARKKRGEKASIERSKKRSLRKRKSTNL